MTDAQTIEAATIPQRLIGPIRICGPVLDESVMVPLATLETPLWPSTARGAKVTEHAGGIHAVVVSEKMTRSVLVEANDSISAHRLNGEIIARRSELEAEVSKSSRFAKLLSVETRQVARLIFIRFELATGDAAGHNMATLAADRMLQWILATFPELAHVSVSGNYCTDKKVSAVNGILGRGRSVNADVRIPAKLCRRFLKTTPAAIVDLNVKKNLIGSIVSGSVLSANAHFANMLLAFYLATGQDAANIVEGSQGVVHAELDGDDLYFGISLPNLIIGSIGNGKDAPHAERNLEALGCADDRAPGENAQRLAAIAAATVLCGELSLLAALTNPGELMAAHQRFERG